MSGVSVAYALNNMLSVSKDPFVFTWRCQKRKLLFEFGQKDFFNRSITEEV